MMLQDIWGIFFSIFYSDDFFNSWWHEGKTAGLQPFPERWVNCRPVRLVQEGAQTNSPQSCTRLLNSGSAWQLNYEKSDQSSPPEMVEIFFFFLSLPLLFSGLQGFNMKWKIQKFCKFHHKDIYTMKSGNVYFPYCFFWWTGLLSHVLAIHNQWSTKAEKLIISCATPVCCHPFLFIKEMNNYKGSMLNCNYCSLSLIFPEPFCNSSGTQLGASWGKRLDLLVIHESCITHVSGFPGDHLAGYFDVPFSVFLLMHDLCP